ncbi:helix-turn-helix domain-containing protein [Beijerinckia sp. L45]|uniref:helix-turn-helix domain-containing protein n=1 Tax=Beijerinckia sp. L45 TaxID=1641855 RepID=UPI001FF06A52|nr:helix-turn-helix domain-containing protein [Beijerinckia sp. L45]
MNAHISPAELETAIRNEQSLPLWPHTGQALRISRNSTYAAAKKGDIPTIKVGGSIRVPATALRKMLGIEPKEAA